MRLIAAFFLTACALKPLPDPDPRSPIELCLEDSPLVYQGSCGDNRVTAEGWTCAVCGAARGCVTRGFVFCTGALACDDPHCGPLPAKGRKP